VDWFQVAVQLIVLLLLDAKNISKALVGYRVLILMQMINSSSNRGIIPKLHLKRTLRT